MTVGASLAKGDDGSAVRQTRRDESGASALAGHRDGPYQLEDGAQRQLGITPASSTTAHYHVKSTTTANAAGDVFGVGIHIELNPANASVLHVGNDGYNQEARLESHRQQRRRKEQKTHRVTLFSAQHIGLLVSLMFASLLTSVLKRGLLPVMKAELRLQHAQLDAAQILLTLPWACSFIVGFCSDVFPIFGCYRKSYMILGWVLTSLALFALAFVNYIREYDLRIQRDDATLGETERTNTVNIYVFLLGLAAFGGILSVIVAEIYVIQQSRRESMQERGHLAGTFLLTQFGFEMAGQFITSVVIFRTTRLGFVPLYSFRSIVLFLVLFALVPIPVLLCFFKERSGEADERQQQDSESKEVPYLEKMEDKQSATIMRKLGYKDKRASVFATNDDFNDDEHGVAVLGASRFQIDVAARDDDNETSGRRGTVSVVKDHLSMVWTTLQQEATWHIVRFLVVFTFCTEFTLNYPHELLDTWCAISLKMESSGKTLAEAMYFLAAYVWKMLCINGNWRVMLGSTLLGVFLVPQCMYFLLVTFDVTRNPDMYVVVKSLRGFIRGIIIVIEAAVTIEIAPRGGEGATFGMIVSIGTVMRLLATTGSNILGNAFDSSSDTDSSKAAANFGASDGANSRNSSLSAIASDTSTVRHRVMVALLVCYGVRLLGVFGLAFLPRQKKEFQRMLRYGAFPLRRAHAWSTIALLLGSLAFVVVVNTWIVVPRSSIGITD
ncbi:Transmembrane protein, partial [Globisporangium splendens]